MGTGVFGGMLAATFVATIFVPLFFVWMSRQRPGAGKGARPRAEAPPSAVAEEAR